MTWLDLTRNWAAGYARLQRSFPHLETDAMPFLKNDRGRFESYLASTHGLTLREARQACDDFLLTSSLADTGGTGLAFARR